MKWLALVLASASFGAAAWSDDQTGNWIYFGLLTGDKVSQKLNTSENDYRDYMTVVGYAMGVADMMQAGSIICVPDKTEWGMVEKTIYLHLKEHPEDRALPAIFAIRQALDRPFKCLK